MEKVLNKYVNGNVTIFNSKYDESINYGISNIKVFNFEFKNQEYLDDDVAERLYDMSNADSYLILWCTPKRAIEIGTENFEGWRFSSVWISGPDTARIGLFYRKGSEKWADRDVGDKFIIDNGSGVLSSKVCSSIVSLCGHGDSILDIKGNPSSALPAWASRSGIRYYGFISNEDMYKEAVARASQLEIPGVQMDLIS